MNDSDKTDDLVVVLWLPKGDKTVENINMLTCHNGVRGFEKDYCDPRCGRPPYFDRLADGAEWALARGGGPMFGWQVRVKEAKRYGLLDDVNVVDFSGRE
jgi:hypothetical protein